MEGLDANDKFGYNVKNWKSRTKGCHQRKKSRWQGHSADLCCLPENGSTWQTSRWVCINLSTSTPSTPSKTQRGTPLCVSFCSPSVSSMGKGRIYAKELCRVK